MNKKLNENQEFSLQKQGYNNNETCERFMKPSKVKTSVKYECGGRILQGCSMFFVCFPASPFASNRSSSGSQPLR
jgi:hypothetical protein